MKRTFQIYRYDPEKDAKPYMQTVEIELTGDERMLLDALMKLKAQDPTLSFRRSCREGVCGSDAMNISGKNGLACLTNMLTLKDPIVLKPLPGLPVVRDLIVDMTQFFKQYHSIKPYLINDNLPPEKERLHARPGVGVRVVAVDLEAALRHGLPCVQNDRTLGGIESTDSGFSCTGLYSSRSPAEYHRLCLSQSASLRPFACAGVSA